MNTQLVCASKEIKETQKPSPSLALVREREGLGPGEMPRETRMAASWGSGDEVRHERRRELWSRMSEEAGDSARNQTKRTGSDGVQPASISGRQS